MLIFVQKDTEDRRFWTKSERAQEKDTAREVNQALSGNAWEKTIFQVEKKHFS